MIMKNIFTKSLLIIASLPIIASAQTSIKQKDIPDYSTKDRKDIPLEYTWNVDDIYKTKEQYKKAEVILKRYISFFPYNDEGYRELAIVYKLAGDKVLSLENMKMADKYYAQKYKLIIEKNFINIKNIARYRGKKIIFMQYPLRTEVFLQNIFKGEQDVLVVSNKSNFEEALKSGNFKNYFVDMFAGDFGHCSKEGNKLIAENLKNVILKDKIK